MNHIIINADDLGLTNSVNKGIFEAIDAGVVSDVSLLAVGDGYDDAVKGLLERNIKTIGLHFCIVDKEKPLSLPSEASLICENDGSFFTNRNRIFAKILFKKDETLKFIKRELELQIKKIKNSGFKITHFDSHQHVHLFPGIADIFVETCYRHNIPFMRLPKTLSLRSPLTGFAVGIFAWRLERLLKKYNIKFVPFCGFEYSGCLTEEKLRKILIQAKQKFASEFMVHPGKNDNYTQEKYAHWNYDWSSELSLLLNNKHLINDLSLKLINFEYLL
ncbi:MAG: hypothetical protein US71_C0003G0028 [Parcubacteria group bacterium GW2011_GWD2_38_12]|nr:MAG: hypothetical protein US06_C0004G0056 [Parcubacteria group bacterium GW2011_GWC2_36_17]KKQ43029.1 MAG: hypothetical protein US61_C0017G0008 [Parcubacteria group bacterium GW2011_GWE2_37_8]KKQ52464.1 MAG: hypothetical protein US71_C0003G0028 [Parcubacteria group bacterium GW2011_GWD2_38_12]KKQ58358.1 MAG: hypothetical protein US79_C0009G0032 [Parcubacteria group bacterium GW2011_GWC1_38_17]KKQ59491.1 MAG: hypothetical protein US78_C0003G0028 [Parcubacteria group bacterium GW2011_GWD1_38_1